MAAPEPRDSAGLPLTKKPARRRRRWLLLPVLIWLALILWHTHKPLPPGVHVDGAYIAVPEASLQFLADVTAMGSDGQMQRRQQVHAATLQLVREAREFLLLDYFLFNGQGGPAGPLDYEDGGLAPVSRELLAALRELRQAQPSLPVLVLTDPINDYYRGTALPELAALQALGIDVVVTRLDGLRDSNPLYSAGWRMLVGWWLPHGGEGAFPNVLDAEGPRLPLGALLRLPNFKANHRKLVITSNGSGSLIGIVASANPHDASSAHSNVALRLEGEALRPLLMSELAIARFSGWQGSPLAAFVERGQPVPAPDDDPAAANADTARTRAAVITEGAIRTALVERFAAAGQGDAIDIAQFYLADRPVIEALLAAARRGATVRVLLDPNRDAFGFEKSGVPNRPVGQELLEKSRGAIALRWYRTHGEQFHAKLAAVRRGDSLWFTLGSANFTRRNIGDYNLEANVAVEAPSADPVAGQVLDWFETLWNNAGGIEYTDDAAAWREESRLRYWQYRIMEASGLSTF
jgi:phosphatidylserine/phosphatidylglycerophosphate/cardiolipin synthase-like enzyme